MNGVDVADLGRAQNAINLEITFRARRGPNADCFVRHLDMEGIDVGFRVNRQGPNPEFFAGTNHSQRDFAAVSNQDFLKHGEDFS